MFNRYRLKRKWGRGLKKTSDLVFMRSNDATTSLKDFSWHSVKENPLWTEGEKIDWKKQIEIGILTIAILASIIVCLYAPYFRINSVQVAGLQRISQEKFIESINSVMNYRRFLILPGSDYFVADLSEMKAILAEKFPLESITITKKFPNTLMVSVEEKISTIIYDNGIEYSYLDIDGNIVEILRKVGDDEWQEKSAATSSTPAIRVHIPKSKQIKKEIGDYPIVYDERAIASGINTNVLDKETVAGIIQWFNLLNKQIQIPPSYFIISDGLGEGVIKTGEGWYIKTNFKRDVDSQFNELQYILKQKINRKSVNYIDLRYPGKVYWQ